MITIIDCIYEELKPETYQGMRASLPNGMQVTFFSSVPKRDYLECLNYLYYLGFKPEVIMNSSSLDHFFMEIGVR